MKLLLSSLTGWYCNYRQYYGSRVPGWKTFWDRDIPFVQVLVSVTTSVLKQSN